MRYFVLILVLASCTEYVFIEDDVLTIEDVNSITEPNRNAYNFWVEKTFELCDSIAPVSDSVCGGMFVSISTYETLNSKYTYYVSNIEYHYSVFIQSYQNVHCKGEVFKHAYDSLRLRNYEIHAGIDPFKNVLLTISERVRL